jgi:Fe2+ transport system protein FeoA
MRGMYWSVSPVRWTACNQAAARGVISIDGDREFRRRMLEMGFCNHACVELVRRAPFGDPIVLRPPRISPELAQRSRRRRCWLHSSLPDATRGIRLFWIICLRERVLEKFLRDGNLPPDIELSATKYANFPLARALP